MDEWMTNRWKPKKQESGGPAEEDSAWPAELHNALQEQQDPRDSDSPTFPGASWLLVLAEEGAPNSTHYVFKPFPQ